MNNSDVSIGYLTVWQYAKKNKIDRSRVYDNLKSGNLPHIMIDGIVMIHENAVIINVSTWSVIIDGVSYLSIAAYAAKLGISVNTVRGRIKKGTLPYVERNKKKLIKADEEWVFLTKVMDLSNKRFGYLTVKEFHSSYKGIASWMCECDCGNTKVIRAGCLTSGGTKSCGCMSNSPERIERFNDSFQKYRFDDTTVTRLYAKQPSNNTSGRKGVAWCKNKKRWVAYIILRRKRIHLGYHREKEDAIKAREEAEKKYFQPIIKKAVMAGVDTKENDCNR